MNILKKEYLPFYFNVFVLGLFLAACIGWVLNIIEVVKTISDPMTTLMLARLVGVIAAPLGAILGYF